MHGAMAVYSSAHTGILSSDGIDHVLWALPRMTLNIYCTLKPDSIKIKNAHLTGIKTTVAVIGRQIINGLSDAKKLENVHAYIIRKTN